MATTGYTLTRADLEEDELKPAIRRFMDGKGEDYQTIYPDMMRVLVPKGAWEDEQVMGGVGLIPKIDEGDLINVHHFAFGGKTRFFVDTRQSAIAITDEDKDQERIGKLNMVLAARADAIQATKEIVAASIWNSAFSTSQVIWDGKPIFAGAGNAASTTPHSLVTRHISTGALTQDNTLATAADISMTSVRDMWNVLILAVAHTGIPTNLMKKILLVHHPVFTLTVEEILDSVNFLTYTGGVPDNSVIGAKNVIGNKGIVGVPNIYLQDQDAWFMVAMLGKQNMVVVENPKPKDESFRDPYTRCTWYSEEFKFAAGCSDWTGMVGTPGAA